jgi:hypothetical protein
MNLPHLAMVVFLLCRSTAAHSSRRQRRTLSATAKKPASMAGFLYLFLNMTSADRSFSSQDFTTLPTSLPSVAYSNSNYP